MIVYCFGLYEVLLVKQLAFIIINSNNYIIRLSHLFHVGFCREVFVCHFSISQFRDGDAYLHSVAVFTFTISRGKQLSITAWLVTLCPGPGLNPGPTSHGNYNAK